LRKVLGVISSTCAVLHGMMIKGAEKSAGVDGQIMRSCDRSYKVASVFLPAVAAGFGRASAVAPCELLFNESNPPSYG